MLKSLYEIAGFPAVEIWKRAPAGRPEEGNPRPAKSLTDCTAAPAPRLLSFHCANARAVPSLVGGGAGEPLARLGVRGPGAASPALPFTDRLLGRALFSRWPRREGVGVLGR